MQTFLLVSLFLLAGCSTASLVASIDPVFRVWLRVGLALAGLAGTIGYIWAAGPLVMQPM
jgi:hypothetical protein